MIEPLWMTIAKKHEPMWMGFPNAKVLSNNGISIVYHDEKKGLIYKQSIPFLTENEFFFLYILKDTDCVPIVEQIDRYTLSMPFYEETPIFDEVMYLMRLGEFVNSLKDYNIRHGDLTKPNIISNHGSPIVLDWAEARFYNDPRPTKRPQTDMELFSKYSFEKFGIKWEEEKDE